MKSLSKKNFKYLDALQTPIIIVETGCLRDQDNFLDGQSTLLFDKYTLSRGNNSKVYTVDISPKSTKICKEAVSKNVEINSGTVIGGSGFGLFTKNKKHSRIPHIGNVVISKDVSIGSNCCIDRGTINDTEIGENTYMDNLVQIAHNVKIGKGCIIAGQTGIAGSTILGNYH